MSNTIKFSVLSYSPSVLTNERINIGIAMQNTENNDIIFENIKNWGRVEHFDDELDVNVLKIVVAGIKNKLTHSLHNQVNFMLEDFTRYFVNELKFEPIQSIEYSSFKSGIDFLKKIHLRYDFEKHERLNEDQSKKYLKLLLNSSHSDFSSKPIVGSYNENVKFDFILNDNECLKIVKINDNNKEKLIHHVKSWAFTCNELSSRYSIKFLIIDDDLADKSFSMSIESILKSCSASVLKYDDYINNFTGNQSTFNLS